MVLYGESRLFELLIRLCSRLGLWISFYCGRFLKIGRWADLAIFYWVG